jgi:superfamily II DNA or RNA helicase
MQGAAINRLAIEKGKEPPNDLTDFKIYWDGYIRLYRDKTQRFSAGILERVIRYLKNTYNIESEVTGRPAQSTFVQHTNTYTLRDYQYPCVEAAIEKRIGIIKSPPRSGKTVIAVALADSMEKFPTVFLCRSRDLAKQAVQEFKRFLPYSVGMVADGQCDIQDITIMTIQSVFSAFEKVLKDKKFPSEQPVQKKLEVRKLILAAKVVFYDESHHSNSETSQFVLSRCKSAEMVIGFSATPHADGDDNIIIEEVLGPIIAEIGYSELIRKGYLLRPYIYMYKLPKHQIDKKDNYQTIYRKEVVENAFLSGLIVKIVNALNSEGESVVVQTEYINHSKMLAKLIGCSYLTGKEDSKTRTDVIDKLKNKKILALVSTLFEEGLDIPSLGYTINVAGNLSNITTFQRMRSITAMDGKDTCGIIDFYHQCKYLHRHSLRRKKLYQSEPDFVYTERDVSKKTLEEIK